MPQGIDQAQAQESDGDTPQFKRTPCCQDELSYHKLDVEQPTQNADEAEILYSELLAVVKLISASATEQPASFPFSSPIIRPPPNPLQLRKRLAQLNVRLI